MPGQFDWAMIPSHTVGLSTLLDMIQGNTMSCVFTVVIIKASLLEPHVFLLVDVYYHEAFSM